MYRTLFDLAGLAIIGWLPLILAPRWRLSRWLARSFAFPAYLAVLYLVGIVPLLVELGPGVMRDFGTADGVLRLLRREDLALVAWIHILAFDQLAGLLLYRDNMERRVVPLPVQSALLVLTLMVGPVGVLLYGAARLLRGASATPRPVAHREVAPPLRQTTPLRPASRLRAAGCAPRDLPGAAVGWLLREPLLTAVGVLGLALGAVCLGLIPVLGVAVPPEGNLYDTGTFNVAVGVFTLCLAAVLPLATWSDRGKRRWRGWIAALTLWFYAIETVQAFRGLDPRFTRHGGVADQVAGALFGLSALAVIGIVMALAVHFWRRPAADPLMLSLRYGFAAVAAGFGTGLWMSALAGRTVGAEGNLLLPHAVGFHGLQAVPVVALMLLWGGVDGGVVRRRVHLAGGLWVAAALLLSLHAGLGLSPLRPTPTSLGAAALLLGWGLVAARSLGEWVRASQGAGATLPAMGATAPRPGAAR